MNNKFFNKKKQIKIWAIISSMVLVILLTVSIVATNRNFSYVLDIVMGGNRAVLSRNEDSAYVLDDGIATKEDAYAYGNEINVLTCEEGSVLLKNTDGALPLRQGAKISVFGKNSVNLVMSGSGSAAAGSGEIKTIYDSLTDAGFSCNMSLKAFYENDKVSGDGRSKNPKIENSGNVVLKTGETPINSYTQEVKKSYAQYSDAAIIVISRIGGEGFDLPRTQSEDNTRHYLQLDRNEEALISEVANNGEFEKIIIVINSANPIELGFVKSYAKIDAAIWIGNPGAQGIMALGRILNGEVNPSGHIADTYVADFKRDPVWQNFGNNGTEKGDRFTFNGKDVNYYFVDYEEGIYVGYRYWETYYETLEGDKDKWYSENIVYPFGYGLSYTEFDWEITEVKNSAIEKDKNIEITIKVTNIGDYAGKDVVQIYAKAPYYANGIEKSSKVLVAFAKTDLLESRESQLLTITVDPYAMSSYDYSDANGNGFKGYELEAGEYILYAARNVHDSSMPVTCTLENGICMETDDYTTDGTVIENLFDDVDDHISIFMSRNDFNGTFPVSPSDENRVLSEEMRSSLKDTKRTANPLVGNSDSVKMPVTGKVGKLMLKDLSGKLFDDPLWDDLLDQITVEEMVNLPLCASFTTANVGSIGKLKTTDADGPNGFTNFMGDPTVYGTVNYCCEGIMASTYNVEIMKLIGNAVGNESLIGNENGDGAPYTGWYAPAMNIHRGQFGGRNCEYFSEDPYLSGIMGAYEIMGCNEKGVITYVKHFVGNEQETHRALGGNCTFTNEQALREIYLKPFEYAVKLGKTKAMMSSFNRLGTTWTGGDYRLITQVLRNEWGFHGSVITDFNTNPSYMNTRQMAYAGGTLDLASQPHDWIDSTSAADIVVLRENTHETLYAVANSNAMNYTVIGYKLSYWKIALIIVDSFVFVSLILWGLIVFLYKRPQENSDTGETVTDTDGLIN